MLFYSFGSSFFLSKFAKDFDILTVKIKEFNIYLS